MSSQAADESAETVAADVAALMDRIRPGDRLRYWIPEREGHANGLRVTETATDGDRRRITAEGESGGTYALVSDGFGDGTPAIYHVNEDGDRTRRGTLESLRVIAGREP